MTCPSSGSDQRFYRISNDHIAYGNTGDIPLTGDWDRNLEDDADDDVAVYRPSNRTYYFYSD